MQVALDIFAEFMLGRAESAILGTHNADLVLVQHLKGCKTVQILYALMVRQT